MSYSDGGMPFSRWISRMNNKLHVPVNATILTLICTVLLALLNLGSSAAFNAILSLQLSSLMASYAICIGCITLRKIRDADSLPKARWSLGKAGLPINIVAFSYATFASFWTFWPSSVPVKVDNFNWAPVIFMGVFIIAMVTYFVKGRKVYQGPVALVKQI